METSFDVIVIGGGFAGVTAARDLSDQGHAVLLLEARERLGGRTLYRPFAGTDQKVEFGGTWFGTRWHTNIAQEIERYGTGVTYSPTPENYRWYIAGDLRSGFPVTLEEGHEFERAMYELIAACKRVDFDVALDHQPLEDLDRPVTDLLASMHVQQPVRDLILGWAALYAGCPPAELSALHLISMLSGFSQSAYSMFYVLSEKFATGTGGMIDAMAEDGAFETALNGPVKSVARSEDQVEVVTRAGDTYTAASVVLAAPLNVWRDIEFTPALSASKREAAALGHPGRSTKVWTLVEHLPHNTLAVGAPELPLGWVSTEFERDGGQTLAVCFGVRPEKLDVHDSAAVGAAIEQLVPGTRIVQTDAHDWLNDEFSRGTWMAHRPGWVMRYWSALGQAEGRLIFAGSDVSDRWAGWIEGAIETGHRAARQAADAVAAKVDSVA